jgi:hypothetical protein
MINEVLDDTKVSDKKSVNLARMIYVWAYRAVCLSPASSGLSAAETRGPFFFDAVTCVVGVETSQDEEVVGAVVMVGAGFKAETTVGVVTQPRVVPFALIENTKMRVL